MKFIKGVFILKKYIIFDFDGTLVDSKDLSIKIINQLAVKYRFEPLSSKKIEALRKLSIVDRCRQLNFPIYKIPFAALEFLSRYRNSTGQLALFDGIKELLDRLKAHGYEIAIISSNSEATIKEFLRKNKIDTISDVICSQNIFGKDQVLKTFLKKHGLKRSQVLYVGDELRDIVACKEANIKIIWVSWGFDAIEATEKQPPNYVAHRPSDIFKIAKIALRV